MSRVSITRSLLDDLAMSISAKSGEAVPLTLTEMKDAVDSIQTGGITPTGNINITQSGQTDVTNYATATVAAGTEGTPTATKGAVSSHSVTVTPSVTNVAGYIVGGTHSGTAVTVSASELVSGSQSITANASGIDVTNLASIDVAVPNTIGLYTIRPDAELIKTYSNDSLVVTDDKATLPAWKSNAATTIKAAANLSGTVSLDYDNYDYFAVERFLTIPVYNTNTIAASRNDYSFGTSMYEIVNIPANSVESMSGTKYGSRSVAVGTYTCYRLLYWTSASAVSLYTSSTYGIHQVTSAPTISSGKWTFKSPTLQFRGSSTYLTEAVYGTITDIRRQFVINVYRAPKNNLNYDAWGLDQSIKHIAACAITNTHTLT